MSDFIKDRTYNTCTLMGDGTAFAAATVTSSAPKVFKFTGFKGQAFLAQLELQWSVLSNSSVDVTIGLYRSYNTSTQVLSNPVAGMSLSAATQAASFTYDVSTATNVHASGGGNTFALNVYLTNAHLTAALPTSDLYVVVITNHAGNSTLSGLTLVHSI